MLSYIVITRDRKTELEHCLASIRQQDGADREVIVVDNGSQDGTPDLVRQQYPEVRLLEAGSNLGVAGGRNRGIREARGDIYVFLDDDAVFADVHAGRRAQELFDQDPRLAVVAFTVRNATSQTEEYVSIPRADKQIIPEDYACSYFCGCGFAARAEAFQEVGLFWESLVYAGEELDLSYRLLERGYRLHHTRTIEILHRSVPLARPKGQYIYFNARNRVLIALRSLPWLWVATTGLLWWGRLGYLGLRSGQLRYWTRGVRDALLAMPETFRQRQRMGPQALGVLQATSGRRWY